MYLSELLSGEPVGIEPLADDRGFRRRFREVKRANKEKLAAIIQRENGITVDGQKVRHAVIQEGTRIEIGSTRMLVHAPSGR